MVSAHAVDGHPDPIGFLDLVILRAALEPAQGVETQGLQHGAGHGSSNRSRR